MNNSPVICIDLGNINWKLGIFQNGKFEIIPNDLGGRVTPSYVAFTNTEILFGEKEKKSYA